jgi:hypothetical protein
LPVNLSGEHQENRGEESKPLNSPKRHAILKEEFAPLFSYWKKWNSEGSNDAFLTYLKIAPDRADEKTLRAWTANVLGHAKCYVKKRTDADLKVKSLRWFLYDEASSFNEEPPSDRPREHENRVLTPEEQQERQRKLRALKERAAPQEASC